MADAPATIALALKQLRKSYGEQVLSTLLDNYYVKCDSISSGLPSFDQITGVGGIPRGKITEIYGAESTGKSLLAETVAIVAQNQGTVLWMDHEHSIDRPFIEHLGLKLGATFLVSQPDTMEQSFTIAETMMMTGQISMVVFDSVAAMLPDDTKNRDVGDRRPGAQSLALSDCLQHFLPCLATSNSAVVFINQLRAKIGSYGSGTTTAGGYALKYYTHLKVELRRKGMLKTGGIPSGMEVIARIVKNKVGPPFAQCTLHSIFGSGFDRTQSLIEALQVGGVLTIGTSGWYKSEALKVNVRGRDAFLSELTTNTECAQAMIALLPALSRMFPMNNIDLTVSEESFDSE